MIELPENVRFMNKRLEELYGYAAGNNPLYKLVWADDQYERRYGVFNEFHGEIFLRQVKGVKEVPKYWWCPGCWILERYVVLPVVDIDKIGREGYEPLWVFRDDKGNPLPVRWDVLGEIVYFNYHGHPSPQFPTDDKMAEGQHKEKIVKDGRETREILDSETSPLMSGFHEGSAILSPGHPDKESA